MVTDFTIADVLVWARTKPADETYDYIDGSQCALCHFLRDTDRAARPAVCPGSWSDDYDEWRAYTNVLEPALQDDAPFSSGVQDWTFGGLVRRLETLCPDAPVPPSEWTRLDAYLTETVAA